MTRPLLCLCLTAAWLLMGAVVGGFQPAFGQDLLGDNITFSSFNLQLRPYVELPIVHKDINSMTTRSGDPRLYVSTQDGVIHVIDEDMAGNTTPTPWFDVATAVQTATGHGLFGDSAQLGLQSVAFHPDFSHEGTPGYGKLYTTMIEEKLADPTGHVYLGNSVQGQVNAESVLVEWTYDPMAGQVDDNSYRELFRIRIPVIDHMIKQAKFNPYAQPGEDDYGMLYVASGDANLQQSTGNDPLDLGSGLGKMIRIDPLESGGDPYTIPTDNPFADSTDPNVLKETYSYGHRNPHTFSFNQDDQGNVHLLVGEIGRDNIEEINLILPGGNYGWPEREGTFEHLHGINGQPDSGYIDGVDALPEGEAEFGYEFPVAQFDHDGDYAGQFSTGAAVASGYVIRNGSDPNLQDQLLFMNFSNRDGNVYHTDLDEMLAAVTQLDPEDLSRDEPSELTQAVIHKLRLEFDDDNDPGTAPQIFDDFQELLNDTRSDTRFGEGVFGEMYISSKRSHMIYLVTNSVPLAGDYNRNGEVDAADYAVWRDSMGQSGFHLPADGNGDGQVDDSDFGVWREHFGEVAAGAGTGASAGGPPSVPEPSTCGLAGMALATLLAALFGHARSPSAG